MRAPATSGGFAVIDDEDNPAFGTDPPIFSHRTDSDLTNVLTRVTNRSALYVCLRASGDNVGTMNTERIRICTDNILAAPVCYHDEYRHHRSDAVR